MINSSRPGTACQLQKPSLTDDDERPNNRNSRNSGRQFLSRSLTFEAENAKQEKQRVRRSSRPTPLLIDVQPQRLARSLLSNDGWRHETMADVRLNAKTIDQSDQNILFGKGIDPLPHVREMLTELSNADAFLYARQCRVVVAKLRLCWIDINEEVKSLLKNKEYTEAALEHIRKDLIINRESIHLRKKPKRESEPDGVDDMLAAEKYHLKKLKKLLEPHVKHIVEQMQKLDDVRHRVAKITKERSIVTELICQCLTSASRTFELSRLEKFDQQNNTNRSTLKPFSRPSSALGFHGQRKGHINHSLSNTLNSSNSNLNQSNTSVESTLLDENGLPYVGHLLAFTPDVIQVFQDAAKLIEESREIKKQAMNQIKEAFNDAKAYSLTVDQCVAQKLADIITLAQHLSITFGENILAHNRAQRWFDITMAAQRTNAGPISSSNLKIAERLDRPIMRTFQRHPGHQVPDAQITAKVTNDLQQSAEETRKQLKALKIVGQRLQANLIDKEVALGVDAHLLRRRRERSNHKWAVTKYVPV